MTSYPRLSPEPLIPWGPGTARESRYDMWEPLDVALQVDEDWPVHPIGPESQTVASLTLHSQLDQYGTTISPSVMIELTAGDCLALARWLTTVANKASAA